MRSNTQMVQKIQKTGKIISLIASKAKDYATLGLTGRQWLASLVICLMLMPIFSLPVGAAVYIPKPDPNIAEFEPVNAEIPIWEKLEINLSARVETWMTAKRELNIIHDENKKKTSDENKSENAADEGVKRKGKKGGDLTEIAGLKSGNENSAEPVEKDTGLNETEKDVLPDENASAKIKSPVKNVAAPSMMLLNQPLPDNEYESIFNYENNLGSPKGQVEMDSTNEAAALRIRHRAGIANFSFGVPLAALSGRGLDAGVSMSYNSRTWNKSQTYDSNTQTYTPHFTYDVEQSWIAPGFSSGFGYLETRAVTQYIHPHQSSNFSYYTEIIPLGLIDADGTRHQFQCTGYTPISGSYTSKCNNYKTTDGTFINVPAKPWISNPGNSQTPNTSQYQNTSFTITYSNGTKVWFSGGFGSGTQRKHYPVMIQDNNGNRVRINYKADQSGRIDFITDTLNRQIKFYYENNTNGNPDKLVAVTIPGINTNDEIQTVRFYYEDMTLSSAGKFSGQITAPPTIRVLRYVYMPATNTGYKYDYHSNYGMIKKITRQVGMIGSTTATNQTGTLTEGAFAASTEYNFSDGSTALEDVPKYTKRTDDWAGRTSTDPQETFYNAPEPIPGQDIYSDITVKDNGFDVKTENISASTGLLKETSVKKMFGPAGQYSQLMSKTKYFWDGSRNLTKIETTNEAGLVRAVEYEYDGYNNQTKVKEYDYAAAGDLGTLLRTTEIAYETGSGWINKNLLGLVKSVKTIVNSTTVSKTLFEYDHNGNDATLTRRDDISTATHDRYYNPAHPSTTEEICPFYDPDTQNALPNGCIIIHNPGYDSTSAFRGNVTKLTSFADSTLTTDPNADITNYNYDIAGNLVSASLSCCQVRTYEYHIDHQYAFPVSQTSGSSPQMTTSVTYNRNTGLVLTSTDENNQVTNYQYESDTLRRKKTIYSNGGYTETEYSDKLAPLSAIEFVRVTNTLDTNKTAQSYSYFDGRGLGIRNATQTPDGWSVSTMEYDKLGRPVKSYNPFYSSIPNGATPNETKFTEVLNYDALGRTTSVRLQDLTTVSTAFSDTNTTPAEFNKTFVTVTDQAGKQRRQVADALGRIVRVDEPNLSGSLGAVDAPIQPTTYEYDGNDNLSKVIQTEGTVTQVRKFKYDALARLTHEKQVEASPTLDNSGVHGSADPNKWTKVLKYNLDGLVSEATDARGVKTTFSYDGLNRVTSLTFTDGTPTVTYTYDQARTGFFNKNALTRVETADGGTLRPETPATATEFDYDQMGRVVKHRQSIGTQTYAMEYGYNLAGQLTSEKYPSGRIVSTGYDVNGRLSQISDQSRNYLNNLQYQLYGGALSSMTLGNGIQQTFDYNERLQMKQISWTKNNNVIQRYDYKFGQIDPNNNTVDATKNNGQLAQVESYIGGTVSNPTKQFTQKFSYDAIGRLEKETETRGDNSNQVYQQKFSYDRFGNRYLKAADNPANQNPLYPTPIEDNNIDRTTNRLASNTNTLYDDAGNITTDGKYRNLKYYYDANGRMFKTSQTNDTNQANTVYDASGNKVATKVNDVWRFLIYDARGKLIAEYGGTDSTDEGGVKFVHQDLQGSTRGLTNLTGTVLARIDYQAFGEEIPNNIGQRTAQGYETSDSIRQRYGLTNRDEATELDDTWFRKLEQRGGRWTTPDPYKGSMNLGNPQSFNRYSYVENEPTNYIDPSGLLMAAPGSVCARGYLTTILYGNSSDGFQIVAQFLTCYEWAQSGGSPTALTVKENEKLDKRIAKIKDQLKKEKCKKFLESHGISISDLNAQLDDQSKRFSGPKSTNYTVAEAGLDGDPSTQNWTVSTWFKKKYGGRIQAAVGSNDRVFYKNFNSVTTILHENLHVSTGLGDVALANKLGLKHDGTVASASPAISAALIANGCT